MPEPVPSAAPTATVSLVDQLEALLFVANEPLSLGRLASATHTTSGAVKTALAELDLRLTGGIRLSFIGQHYRLVTARTTAPVIGQFLQSEAKAELSRAALETLAIIAYRGPITRTAIEHIRGVASETTLRNLSARDLITSAGKSPEPGRPTLYTVSQTFLQHFGLTRLSDLPPAPHAAPELATQSITPEPTS